MLKRNSIIQIFNKSMAAGIQFYRNREKYIFKYSHETEDFTLLLNNLFDVLNRKFSA